MTKSGIDIKFSITVILILSATLTIAGSWFVRENTTWAKGVPSIRISGTDVIEKGIDPLILEVLKPDKYLNQRLLRQDGRPLEMFVAFYGSIEKADLSHSPLVCFTGQGWNIVSLEEKTIPVRNSEKKAITVNLITAEKQQNIMISAFWYQTGRKTFTNRGYQKIYLLFRRVIGKSQNNAFVLLSSTHSSNAQGAESAKNAMVKMVNELYPEIRGVFEG